MQTVFLQHAHSTQLKRWILRDKARVGRFKSSFALDFSFQAISCESFGTVSSCSEKSPFTCKQITWWFCNRASIARACTSVDEPVNKTTLWLHPDLKPNCRHMLPRALSWIEFYFFCPTALFIRGLSTYLSKKCWNKVKRKSYKSLRCQAAIRRHKNLPVPEK